MLHWQVIVDRPRFRLAHLFRLIIISQAVRTGFPDLFLSVWNHLAMLHEEATTLLFVRTSAPLDTVPEGSLTFTLTDVASGMRSKRYPPRHLKSVSFHSFHLFVADSPDDGISNYIHQRYRRSRLYFERICLEDGLYVLLSSSTYRSVQ